MKSILVSCVVLFVLMITSVRSFGDSLRKTDFATVEAGAFVWGDPLMDDTFGPFIDLFGSFNKKINDNFAALVKAEYITADGETQGIDVSADGVKGGASLVYMLSTAHTATPYLLGGGLVEYRNVAGSAGNETAEEDDTDLGFELGGGVEFDFNPKTLLDLGLLYQNISDFDSIAANVKIGYALTDEISAILNGSYAFDEEDYFVRGGLAFKL